MHLFILNATVGHGIWRDSKCEVIVKLVQISRSLEGDM